MATESDNVNSGALGTLLAVGTVAMLAISLVVTALVRAEMTNEADSKEVGADRPYRDLVAEQTAKMAAPASVTDRARGVVSLPIDRAMEVTVSSLIKDPNSATPPAPIGGTGGSAATEAGGSSAGGTGGTGGTTGGAAPAEATQPAEEPKPAEGAKPTEEKKDEKKKEAPKPRVPATPVPAAPAAPVPAAPAPVAPAP